MNKKSSIYILFGLGVLAAFALSKKGQATGATPTSANGWLPTDPSAPGAGSASKAKSPGPLGVRRPSPLYRVDDPRRALK